MAGGLKGFLFRCAYRTYYFKETFWYKRCLKKFRALNHSEQYPVIDKMSKFALLSDHKVAAGSVSCYLYQDLWGAKKVFELPAEIEHFDIGSRIDGFIAHLLSFRSNIVLIDIRPMDYFIDRDLKFIQADATNLEGIADCSIDSISALCSIEHFGMGRYGDPIDPFAHNKVILAIQRVLKPGGRAFISVPIGKEQVVFNAHRIFNPRTIINEFNQMDLMEFSVIDTSDKKTPVTINADIDSYSDVENHSGSITGLFDFVKI